MSQIKILTDVDIKLLKPYTKNCFDHSVNLNEIANSIRDFGFNKLSIGIDEENILLYGHGTLLALRLLGYKVVPWVAQVIGLTDDQKKCYRVADNTSGFNSRIIKDLIKKELSQQLTFDFANYGLPIEYLFDMSNLTGTDQQCNQLAQDFQKENPNIIHPEKLWMYIEFRSPQEWEQVIKILGLGKSRRILDTEKFMEMVNAQIPKT